ncbi:hypothetical protein [Frederiksenia canicola]|uniref:hypothetical protein n=1 Tax=Frederiksenia canicola TaxID=123824 RepID=UPI0014044883|nr:hypothetical protein [Frederiksenia canicola]
MALTALFLPYCQNADQFVAQHLLQVEQKIAQPIEIKAIMTSLSGCNQNHVEQCKVMAFFTE